MLYGKGYRKNDNPGHGEGAMKRNIRRTMEAHANARAALKKSTGRTCTTKPDSVESRASAA